MESLYDVDGNKNYWLAVLVLMWLIGVVTGVGYLVWMIIRRLL